ncbi:hemerythrin domain-containing protein [Sphingobium chlorophenolicum]|uniref:Hemerythrin HHE cation binding domain protein n=1 Tax=Sphingobium chlorophenolicum TaxID=46429 RepID=A0A081RE28_SPHCR|nr:hemerythrin domain-containing protein [Sphingobium chlorophenolicum]KEQ53451.1 Hemerythrin HHE cation binding domain protein [Sphingobium chlorophenolicum]
MALHASLSSDRHSHFLLGAGLGMGLALLGAAGRKLMVQAPTMLAGDWDEALAAEHKATLLLFDGLARTEDSATARRTLLLMQLKHALGKHALEEENAVYPAMREHGMTEEADALNADHGYVKQYLYELSDLAADNGAFQQKLAAFRTDIEAHMRREEEELFPRLRRALDEGATGDLTRRMNQEGLKLA